MPSRIIRYRWAIWIGVGLSVGGAVAAVWRLPVDTDVLSLLSPDDPVLSTYRTTEVALPLTSTFVVVVPSDDTAALAAAATALQGLDEVAEASVGPGREGESLIHGRLTRMTLDLEAIRATLREVREALDAHLPSYRLTGMPVVLLEGTDWLQEDVLRAGLVALVLLAVFFTVFYRDGVLALLAVVPVAAGLMWALGVWSLAGQRLTLLAATGQQNGFFRSAGAPRVLLRSLGPGPHGPGERSLADHWRAPTGRKKPPELNRRSSAAGTGCGSVVVWRRRPRLRFFWQPGRRPHIHGATLSVSDSMRGYFGPAT